MPCLVCGHTMHGLGVPEKQVFWCPRCGALKTELGEREEWDVPRLVHYVRDAEELSVLASADGKTLQCAIPRSWWIAVCEAVGRLTEAERKSRHLLIP